MINDTMEQQQQTQEKQQQVDIPWAWINAVNDVLSTGPFEEPEELPVQILPWLYLSDIGGIYSLSKLMQLGVTHVLTTNKMYSNQDRENLTKKLTKVGIRHLAVGGVDDADYDMIGAHWEECRAFLQQAKNNTNSSKVVVHCAAGQNRSGLVVAAALVSMERMPLLDAVKLVKEKRGIVLTNRSFQQQLCVLAVEEGLLGDKPTGYKNEERVLMKRNDGDRWS